jgi:hypothetical protein
MGNFSAIFTGQAPLVPRFLALHGDRELAHPYPRNRFETHLSRPPPNLYLYRHHSGKLSGKKLKKSQEVVLGFTNAGEWLSNRNKGGKEKEACRHQGRFLKPILKGIRFGLV